MDYFTYEERLKYLLEMPQKGRLYGIEQAARQFGCSKSTVKRMLQYLRRQGYDIRFSRKIMRFVLRNMQEFK